MDTSGSIQEQQSAFLAALINNGGLLTEACTTAGIERGTFFKWLEDQNFEERYGEALEAVVDQCEEELLKAIQGGNTMALLFTLATRGRGRGYGVDAADLSEILNVALEERYRQVIMTLEKTVEEQGAVVREAHEYVKKLKVRIAELEPLVQSDATD